MSDGLRIGRPYWGDRIRLVVDVNRADAVIPEATIHTDAVDVAVELEALAAEVSVFVHGHAEPAGDHGR